MIWSTVLKNPSCIIQVDLSKVRKSRPIGDLRSVFGVLEHFPLETFLAFIRLHNNMKIFV